MTSLVVLHHIMRCGKLLKKTKYRKYEDAWVWFPKDFNPDADVFPEFEKNVAEFEK